MSRPADRAGLDAVESAPNTEISWRSDELGSLERCRVRGRPGGFGISGVVDVPIGDEPVRITYQVHVDAGWSTQDARIDIGGRRGRRITVAVRRAEWYVDGARRHDLTGATDIDLGWTPATNLLPVRRLDLAVAQTATIEAAWLTFPELEFARSVQTYDRVDAQTWRYRAGAADHLLTVNGFGLVTRYGDGLWYEVERRREPDPHRSDRHRT